MKKRLFVVFLIFLLIFSINYADAKEALTLEDFWNNLLNIFITGKAVAPGDGEVQPIYCTNKCSSGSKQCYGSGYQICGDYNFDGCLEWSAVTSFTYGCSNGECITSTCTDSDLGKNYYVRGNG